MPGLNEYKYTGKELEVTEDMKKDFDRDGFIVVKGLLNAKEVAIIEEAFSGPDSLTSYAYGNEDTDGKKAKMCIWNHEGNDVTGALARTKKMAGTVEKLLGHNVYHHHSKLMMKEAKTGGKFVWHQDYGYWYNMACLFPDMMTIFVAIDRCGRDNGCLQVLRGSHRCGRIGHGVAAGQVGADLDRVKVLQDRLESVFVELQPGDALFFHCNLLHTSSANESEHRRWAILSAYNADYNAPYEKHIFGPYQPLRQLENDAVETVGVNRDIDGKDIIMKDETGKYYTARP